LLAWEPAELQILIDDKIGEFMLRVLLNASEGRDPKILSKLIKPFTPRKLDEIKIKEDFIVVANSDRERGDGRCNMGCQTT